MKNISLVVIILSIASLTTGALTTFVPELKNESVSELATCIFFTIFGLGLVCMAHAKTEKQWATNFVVIIGTIFGGLIISVVISYCFFPEILEVSRNRRLDPVYHELMLQKGRMIWLTISGIILVNRQITKKHLGLISLD
jgi:hypothetical protein